MKGKQVKGMEYELTALKEFEESCEAKRVEVSHMEVGEQKVIAQRVFFARTLLFQEASVMMENYTRYMTLVEESNDQKDIREKIQEIDDMDLRKEFLRESEMGMQLSKYQNSKLWNIQEQFLKIVDLCFVDEPFDTWKQVMLKRVGKLLMLPDIFRLPHITDDMKKVLHELQKVQDETSEDYQAEEDLFYEVLLDVIAAVKSHKENLERGYHNRQKKLKEKYKETLHV